MTILIDQKHEYALSPRSKANEGVFQQKFDERLNTHCVDPWESDKEAPAQASGAQGGGGGRGPPFKPAVWSCGPAGTPCPQ